MTRTKILLCAALALCVWLTACGPTWYSIILTPDGPVMERKISQYFGPEELERVALLYSQEIDAGTLAKFEDNSRQKNSLTGTFGADMPADSHNSGTYLYCDSPLGSAAVYTERFGGRHDLATMLREQEQAFNLFWDIVLLHLDALVGDSPDYAALRSFLDTTMRTDMWDLALDLTVTDLGEDGMSNLSELQEMPDDVSAMLMRALHFLDDRGYVSLRETLELLATADFSPEDVDFIIKTVGTAVGRRMGTDEGGMPASFEALIDYPDEQLEEELERIANTDERVLRILAEFRAGLDGMSVAEPESSMSALVEEAFVFDFDLLGIGGDAREVTLYIPVEPYMTNGAWITPDEIDGTDDETVVAADTRSYVQWQYPLADVAPGADVAQVVFAFWAEPDDDYQVERFGFRILDDNSLAKHCRWRQELGPSLRDEWDAFIDGLRPGPHLDGTLRRFRFSIEDPPEPDGHPTAFDSLIAGGVLSELAYNLRRQSQN